MPSSGLPSSALLLLSAAAWSLSCGAAPAQTAPSPAPAVPAATAPPAVAAPVADSPALPPLPERPASHILDESGMLPEETRQSLSARLLSCQTRTGLGVYLAIHTYLLDETADLRARRAHSAWLAEKDAGIVVIHDRSTGRLNFAGSDDKRLPDADGLLALYRVADAASKNLPPEATAPQRIVATLTSLADGLESWQKNGRLPQRPSPAASPPRESTTPGPLHTQAPWTLPDTFLLDEARVFPDSAAASLRARLDAWHRETGLRLYVVTVTYPPPGLPLPLAEKLALQWLPDSLGGILIFDRSRPETLTFGGTPQVGNWLSPVQLKSLHERALGSALAASDLPAARLTAAVDTLTAGYTSEGLPLLQESRRWLPQAQRHLLPYLMLGLAAGTGLLYLFKRWQERAERRRRTVFLFPEVFVPERLGAPHGGGVTAETPLPASPATPGS